MDHDFESGSHLAASAHQTNGACDLDEGSLLVGRILCHRVVLKRTAEQAAFVKERLGLDRDSAKQFVQ